MHTARVFIFISRFRKSGLSINQCVDCLLLRGLWHFRVNPLDGGIASVGFKRFQAWSEFPLINVLIVPKTITADIDALLKMDGMD